jgi:uncharacterized membrane protein
MDWAFLILLFLHIGGAVVGFGPTFAFPLLGPMAGREPAHANFALRFQRRVATTLIVPLALFQGITGLLLIWRVGYNIFATGWLLAGIALYLVLLGMNIGIALPTVSRLIALTSAPPPPTPAGVSPPAGPPPEVAALVRRGRLLGVLSAVLIVTIVFLMVTKPF